MHGYIRCGNPFEKPFNSPGGAYGTGCQAP